MMCRNKFQPRYSERYPEFMSRITRISGSLFDVATERIYECDVCVKCGEIAGKKND